MISKAPIEIIRGCIIYYSKNLCNNFLWGDKMSYSANSKGINNLSIENIRRNIISKLKQIENGSLTVINQDGHSVQVNINETYLEGNYLC